MIRFGVLLLLLSGAGVSCRSPQPPPEDSPLHAVSIGDSKHHVRMAMGAPDDTGSGNGYRPHWGGFRTWSVWYYRSVGRVVFDFQDKVMRLEPDPGEDGVGPPARKVYKPHHGS